MVSPNSKWRQSRRQPHALNNKTSMPRSRWKPPQASGYLLLPMASTDKKVEDGDLAAQSEYDDVAVGMNEDAAIPKGTLDPVYEAKARILNKAIQDIGMGWVRALSSQQALMANLPDHSAVSMAALHCCGLWLGERQVCSLVISIFFVMLTTS